MFMGFIRSIQDQAVLEQIAEAVQPVLKSAFRGTTGSRRDLKNVLSGTWIGHPMHPIVKDIPIGMWTAAALLDASRFEAAADLSIAAGLAGALVSAITGLSDWSDTNGRARRV